MLEFKQVEGSGPPMDIEVVTDDGDAELASLSETLEEGEFYADDWQTVRNLDDVERGEDGKFRFIVPGDEAGEFGDYWEELGVFLEDCNAKAMAAAEAAAQETDKS